MTNKHLTFPAIYVWLRVPGCTDICCGGGEGGDVYRKYIFVPCYCRNTLAKCGDLKNKQTKLQQCIYSQFWRPEAWNQGVDGLVAQEALGKNPISSESLLTPDKCWQTLLLLDFQSHHSHFCLYFYITFSSFSPGPPLSSSSLLLSGH